MIKLLLPLAFLSYSFLSFGQINFQSLSIDEAITQAKSEDKKVFIDVFTTWCGPCKLLDKNVFKNSEIGNRMNPDYVSIKVDAERYPDQARLTEFKIRAYPTMLILDGDGKLIKTIIGNMSVEAFHDELDAFIDPALLPKNIALKEMEEHPNDEAIWRKNMMILLKKDGMKFRNNCQAFVDKFGLKELANDLDSNIFYGAILPLKSTIVQKILADSSYMYYAQELYYKINLKERARTAPTEEEYLSIVEEAKAAEKQRYMDYHGDYVTDYDFLESLAVDQLNPVYLQKQQEFDNLSRKERRKIKKEERKKRKAQKNK